MWLIIAGLFTVRSVFALPEGFDGMREYLIPALLFYIIWCVDKYE